MSLANPTGESVPRQAPSQSKQVQKKLIQCAACGTWIPADRAIGGRTGLASYCSTACLENSAGKKEHKLAG